MNNRSISRDCISCGACGRRDNDSIPEIRGQKFIINKDFALYTHRRWPSIHDDFIQSREREHFFYFIRVSFDNRRLNPHLLLNINLFFAAKPRKNPCQCGLQLTNRKVLQKTVDLFLESYHWRCRPVREKTRGFQYNPVSAYSYYDINDFRMEIRVELREICETYVRLLVFLQKVLEIGIRAVVKEKFHAVFF